MQRQVMILACTAAAALFGQVLAAEFYVAPKGSDAHDGSIGKPFATIMAAQEAASAGDTVYLRGGTYRLDESNITSSDEINVYINTIYKHGISYVAYRNEHPVFDFEDAEPDEKRVTAFQVNASRCVFKGFDVVGVPIPKGEKLSACIIVDGSFNRFEQLAMHDGHGIGLGIVGGRENLVLNCDAYNNTGVDDNSDGNIDGFGCHYNATDNRFVGCRAWFNSDDGFDLINCRGITVISNCWAFYNGYDENMNSRRDGNGFKAGGYGRDGRKRYYRDTPPRHRVEFSLAVGNKASGFYANHHTGGLDWFNNTAINNQVNFNLLSTEPENNSVDVDGFDHKLKNNLGYGARKNEVEHLDIKNMRKNDITYNYFTLSVSVSSSDFESLKEKLLMQPRQPSGDLPDIGFARLKPRSDLIDAGVDVGRPYRGSAPDLGAFETGIEQP